jgi:hypothetical protein
MERKQTIKMDLKLGGSASDGFNWLRTDTGEHGYDHSGSMTGGEFLD